MPAESLLEQRLAAVEVAVQELRSIVLARKPVPNWLDRLTGSMQDDPAFEEVLAYGRAFREADRPKEDPTP